MRYSLLLPLLAVSSYLNAAPVQLSGIYPSLAFFNEEGECGTGAVVPWADRLWVVTYAPHSPEGSSDKLYEITPELRQIIRPESIGGTPANRMIHKESQQLFIGPYAIGADRSVRTIPYKQMYGRPTGNARHLFDPAGKIYYATMEEGLYEVDVKTLEVTELWRDEQVKGGRKSGLPGYHGKGLYSGQGRLIYANNGDHARAALSDPSVPSGVLAEWDGKSDGWEVVLRNQFTEVTGPGGITGNESPESDPVWSIGWDHRSLILMCLHGKKWHRWRLPKGSHSYDGAHGWNTEWPRIRDIGEKDFLMTMHGTFWKFPRDFSPGKTAGLAPRSNYLKVVGDFCRWQDRIVLGCDDTAKAEFLNKRKAKGEIAAPQSQSNLWFIDPARLDQIGPVIGRGAVWMAEEVKAGQASDAYLFSGYQRKGLQLSRKGSARATITLEIDAKGDGKWSKAREVVLDSSAQWVDLSDLTGTWIRLSSDTGLEAATALFQYRNDDARGTGPDAIFDGLAANGEADVTGGLVRARAGNKKTLSVLAVGPDGKEAGYYELGEDLKLAKVDDPALQAYARDHTAIPTGVLNDDAASVIFTDDKGSRWRLPRAGSKHGSGPLGDVRVCREVATERDLFHAGGSFYELPAENAGGFAKVRAVATGDFLVHDFCSYRGLFIMTGITGDKGAGNPHVIRSEDGKAALWAGAIDDIWKMGKPRGEGGPWKDTVVKAGGVSDPYLMTGFDKKSLTLKSSVPATVTAEVDITGTGQWVKYRDFKVEGRVEHEFPPAFQAYWIRFTSDRDATADAQLSYR